MSNNYSRYSQLYKKVVRFNSATPFPKHVYYSGANRVSNKRDRLGNKPSGFESTFVHLTERFTKKELFLIGTMNTSTMLAKRTQKLIQDIEPDTVMVMASPGWWDTARLIEDCDSQEEFNGYKRSFLPQYKEYQVDASWARSAIFWPRIILLQAFLRMVFRFGAEFDFYAPGVEIKYACEEAEKLGADLHFLGPELDNITWHRLYHETRLNIPFKFFPLYDMKKRFLAGDSAYVETCLDSYTINWHIKYLEQLGPQLKMILIDKRDMALYKQITKSTDSKRIVAVVNQWHMEGIEHLWAHEYGQLPRSQPFDYIDPIGDMELKEGLFYVLFNAFQREYKSAMTKSVPASYSNMMNTYHREQNWQYEHRNM